MTQIQSITKEIFIYKHGVSGSEDSEVKTLWQRRTIDGFAHRHNHLLCLTPMRHYTTRLVEVYAADI